MSENEQPRRADEQPEPLRWLLTLNGDAEPEPCGTCGLPVHPDCHCAVSPGEDGRPVLHSIRLLRAESSASAR